ncbi:hypothetical protein EP51_12280 [Rhodococcus opacus]|jgi:hypothetical protein|uniref:Uncharacterized protein n=1 Tax=Rhodococcus opacus TaxID=37919 RepID=A0A076EJE8_RHOOP|nr:hypothetical protein EP51_12280 [Rhodococcus opacus]
MVKRLLQLTVVTGGRFESTRDEHATARSETLEQSRRRVDHGEPVNGNFWFTLAETTYGTLPDGPLTC